MGYGEGAVMGVPSHDERDFAFAKKYGMPIIQVVSFDGKEYSTDAWQDGTAKRATNRSSSTPANSTVWASTPPATPSPARSKKRASARRK